MNKFQFVEQNSVECWCDFGATLYATIGFMLGIGVGLCYAVAFGAFKKV